MGIANTKGSQRNLRVGVSKFISLSGGPGPSKKWGVTWQHKRVGLRGLYGKYKQCPLTMEVQSLAQRQSHPKRGCALPYLAASSARPKADHASRATDSKSKLFSIASDAQPTEHTHTTKNKKHYKSLTAILETSFFSKRGAINSKGGPLRTVLFPHLRADLRPFRNKLVTGLSSDPPLKV